MSCGCFLLCFALCCGKPKRPPQPGPVMLSTGHVCNAVVSDTPSDVHQPQGRLEMPLIPLWECWVPAGKNQSNAACILTKAW